MISTLIEGWIQVWYIWYTVRTFVNATIYHPAQLKKEKKMQILSCKT
jgi:hypothetical protein